MDNYTDNGCTFEYGWCETSALLLVSLLTIVSLLKTYCISITDTSRQVSLLHFTAILTISEYSLIVLLQVNISI